MKGILIALAVLLVSGCTPKEEEKTDWLIGRWFVTDCSYVNRKTGERGKCEPGFDMWEFTETGRLLVDGGKFVQEYRHTDGRIDIDSVVYEIVAHGRDMMQLEQRGVNGSTFYAFTR